MKSGNPDTKTRSGTSRKAPPKVALEIEIGIKTEEQKNNKVKENEEKVVRPDTEAIAK